MFPLMHDINYRIAKKFMVKIFMNFRASTKVSVLKIWSCNILQCSISVKFFHETARFAIPQKFKPLKIYIHSYSIAISTL